MTNNAAAEHLTAAPESSTDAPEAANPASNSLLGAQAATVEPVDDPQTQDWTKTFSQEYQAKPYLKEFKSADDLLKSYENQRSLIGKRLEDFSPEQLATYREKLGVPEDAASYKLTLSDDVNREGLNDDWFKETMAAARVPQKEASILYTKYAELVNKQRETYQNAEREALESGLKELDKAWGQAKDTRIKGVVSFMQERGGDDILKAFNESNLKHNASFVQFLSQLAELHAEDRGVNLRHSASWGTTPSEAEAQIKEMKSDPDFLKKVQHDASFKEKWMRLHNLANPQ